ncbi:MAG: uroporphyrinogen decarboxylase [Alphaproteobacteria bacterium]|nr:uroporphyrinogen decarboxylase [Rhodospirillaceae bacterium]MBT6202808.1 uroporphyrinogen decarboxylase [Rhodospirillaceae bacterium]MBT6509045.1 uroporphyrinogen decarboxylase [Rhodospirillaceae bacterium]MBT7613620.1 uroporphyrinogen decarboxylase [Rhodospirillaceae bacterium]MDG2479864.1 uroporphyrinogen decarboxylase [Alphaproteobacteria bacterium]
MKAQSKPESTAAKALTKALGGTRVDPPPVWLMRQAGRYLPEYRALRKQAPDFMACCNNPVMAAEITLQPIRRFALDAAIVFSDILIVPHAMGRHVRFAEGEGPLLEPLGGHGDVDRLDPLRVVEGNQALMETLALVKAELDNKTALIGFAGAPFTLVAYMIDGKGGGVFARTRALMTEDPALLDRLLSILAEAVSNLLIAEIDAGAEAVQIFDSWAGLLAGGKGFERWSIKPIATIVSAVHAARPGVPVIGFPRAAGDGYDAFIAGTGVDAIQVDQMTPLSTMQALQKTLPVQGNLNPEVLLAGGVGLTDQVHAIRAALAGGPHVFNLGHGVIKETPPEHVAELVAALREPSGMVS